jgi:hypothetical protein
VSKHGSKRGSALRSSAIEANSEAILVVDTANPGHPTIDAEACWRVSERSNVERNTSANKRHLTAADKCAAAAQVDDFSVQSNGVVVGFFDATSNLKGRWIARMSPAEAF